MSDELIDKAATVTGGAVRQAPRPTQVPQLWWNPANRRVLWAAEENGWCSTELVARHFDETLPADVVKLVGPDQRRPVVLLRAEDCACPVVGDCPHGPEPVDALDLAVWLLEKQRWQQAERDARGPVVHLDDPRSDFAAMTKPQLRDLRNLIISELRKRRGAEG